VEARVPRVEAFGAERSGQRRAAAIEQAHGGGDAGGGADERDRVIDAAEVHAAGAEQPVQGGGRTGGIPPAETRGRQAIVAGVHVCLRKVDPDLIWDLFERHGVSYYTGAPTVQIGRAAHPKACRCDRQVTAIVAGSPPSPTLIARLRQLNFRPLHVYGLTETYAPATVCEWHQEWDASPEDEQARLLARQGQPYLGADPVRVVDAAMMDVPRDGRTMGEVVMRGNTVMRGYFRDPEGTATAFEGGWFHSGDLAVMHPDGSIELRDRKKDIIISGGENISTIEVEQILARHPAVLECVVIAIPDEHWGGAPQGVRRAQAGRAGDGGRGHRLLSRQPRPFQVPGCGRVWRPAEDLDWHGPEICPV
jgi:acyl-CoA synthetase (AMP-forming)/AMP-acid ligase II